MTGALRVPLPCACCEVSHGALARGRDVANELGRPCASCILSLSGGNKPAETGP
jgi:hypothetical protein